MDTPLYKVLQEEDYPLYLRLGAPSAWGSRGMHPEIWKYLQSQEYLHHPSERLRTECDHAYKRWRGTERALAIGLAIFLFIFALVASAHFLLR